MPRKRARSTWGSNTDAGNGRRRLRFWADLHDGRGYVRHSATIVGSRRDGDEFLARVRVEHSADAPTPTLGQAYDMWYHPELIERMESGDVSRRTVVVYESLWRKHIAPAWADTVVSDIRPLAVQQWLMGMTTDSARRSLMLMSQILSKCVLYEAVDHNVAVESYRMPRRSERSPIDTVYTLDETVRAVEAARGTAAYLPAVLCGIASCRVGESLGPRVDDVRPYKASGMTVAVIDISRQVDRSGAVSERLKTLQSARPVVVPEPWSIDVLEASQSPTAWLCGDGMGGTLSQNLAAARWRSALEAAGMSPIPLRNLRNSWRTYMRWELGVPEDMLEAMMGHAGRNVGEIHYDRPRWEVFASVVADAWARHRAS